MSLCAKATIRLVKCIFYYSELSIYKFYIEKKTKNSYKKRNIKMWPFNKSKDDKEFSGKHAETKKYLESLADHLEKVLRENLGVRIDQTTENIEAQASVLTAYVVLVCVGTARENPNIKSPFPARFESGTIAGEVLKPRLEKWASVARSNYRENQILDAGKKAVVSGGDYLEGLTQVTSFVSREFIEDLTEFASIMDRVERADVKMLKEVKRHDINNSFKDWVTDEISIEEAEQMSKEMVRKIRRYLVRRYKIIPKSEAINKYEESVAGIFYLTCIPCYLRAAKEGSAHLGNAILNTRQKLKEELPESTGLKNLSFLLKSGLAEGDKAAEAIVSWAIAHSKGRRYEWGDDWMTVDYTGEKSLALVLEDALQFHRAHGI